jgi:hypothetical protein
MKLTGKYVRKAYNENNECEITISVPRYQDKYLQEINKTDTYKISIDKEKSQRSILQNDKLWAIITDIANEQGYKDTWELYLQILKKSGAKTTKIPVIKEAIPELKKAFRIVTPLYKIKSDSGAEMIVTECYFGSSSFNTKEMSELIECALEWAENVGLDTRIYEESVK